MKAAHLNASRDGSRWEGRPTSKQAVSQPNERSGDGTGVRANGRWNRPVSTVGVSLEASSHPQQKEVTIDTLFAKPESELVWKVPDSSQTHPRLIPDSSKTHPRLVPDSSQILSSQTHPRLVPDSPQTHPGTLSIDMSPHWLGLNGSARECPTLVGLEWVCT